ncbi:peptidoglycan editing factor PgeF [Aureibacillus halotolerans]|uniref:Purine nucleoside phosphorylase n=1 Tax=Aureibacillus halotolerans TaxID=1508390 RepID=A0A4R6UBI9_9BACI|nr:peptidoglycan editing factor PgeF [Aureibacillus halotolerans]TDQ42339.1 hypothetical protein EV213_102371 [Aureibacillus halotolerans]
MNSDNITLQTKHTLPILYWDRFSDRLSAGVTTRQKGSSARPYDSLNLGTHVGDASTAVTKNYQILAEELQCNVNDFVTTKQVHETTIMQADKMINDEEADGLWTDKHDSVIGMVFADCIPLVFYAPEAHRAAVLHAGWRGTVAGIGSKLLERWAQDDVSQTEVYAFIGPGICRSCYQVNEDVVAQVPKALRRQTVTSLENDQYLLDLPTLNKELLVEAGMRKDHIDTTTYCTKCDSEFFFSYRGSQRTGRHMAFAKLCTKGG